MDFSQLNLVCFRWLTWDPGAATQTTRFTPVLNTLHWLPACCRIDFLIFNVCLKSSSWPHPPPTLFICSGLIFQKQSRRSRLSGQLLSEVQKPKYRRQGDGPFPASSGFLQIYTQSLSRAFLNLIFKMFLQQLLIPGSAMIFYVFCRKAGDAVGVKSGSLETVAEGKMLLMFHSVLNNTHHPHPSQTALSQLLPLLYPGLICAELLVICPFFYFALFMFLI